MTDKAIDIISVFKVERIVFPSISDVAACAPGPVGRNGNAIIIDYVLLSNPYHFTFLTDKLIPQPVPVTGFHYILVNPFMALKAGFSYFPGRFKRPFNKF
jgi:hypothetical protein